MTFNPTVENPQKDVAGIEAAIWCETITNFRDLQFLLMPRLAGVAEKGWSKVENTHWDEYKVRLGAQAPLLGKGRLDYLIILVIGNNSTKYFYNNYVIFT